MHTDERAQPSRVPREAAQSEEVSVCPKGILSPAVCCPQQLASTSPGSVFPCTPHSVRCSASLWLCSLCCLSWEMAQGSQLDQESIPCLSQLHHPSAVSHPSLQDCSAATSSLSTSVLRLRFPRCFLTLPCEVLLRKKCCVLRVLQQNCA